MCGIVGMIDVPRTEEYLFDALRILQHRGQSGAGVAFANGSKFLEPVPHRTMGWVDECEYSWPVTGDAILGIGQTRYGTSGKRSNFDDAQPLLIEGPLGSFCLSHNGDTPGFEVIKRGLEDRGVSFSSTSDSEVLGHLISLSGETSLALGVKSALKDLKSAFSLILARPDLLIGCRDPRGFRPLVLGRLGSGYILASETVAFDTTGAEFVREISPGEMVVIGQDGYFESEQFAEPALDLKSCSFEQIYFSRPDSIIEDVPVDVSREMLGAQLAKECGIPDRDDVVVIGVPDSAMFAARGYANELSVPLSDALIRTHYEKSPRTFTTPGQKVRQNGVRRKFNPIGHRINGSWCVLIDDSLVRGNTMRRLVRMIRRNGAVGVSVMIAAPPIKYPCRYGIDMKSEDELIAAKYCDSESIRQFIEADQLCYLSYEGMVKVLGKGKCYACFDGCYAF